VPSSSFFEVANVLPVFVAAVVVLRLIAALE
jgi:hypothetical protein